MMQGDTRSVHATTRSVLHVCCFDLVFSCSIQLSDLAILVGFQATRGWAATLYIQCVNL